MGDFSNWLTTVLYCHGNEGRALAGLQAALGDPPPGERAHFQTGTRYLLTMAKTLMIS